MRRTAAAALVALATGFTLLPVTAPATGAEPALAPVAAVSSIEDVPTTPQTPEEALATATEVLSGEAAPAATDDADHEHGLDEGLARVDGTLAMRDLFLALPALGSADRGKAEALLARPTDAGDNKPGGPYASPSKKKCKGNFCVHWVTRGADAPPGSRWAKTVTLNTMNKVWKHAVRKLGYRKPPSDRIAPRSQNGGNGKFDVYLKDIGALGLFGYCAPEFVRRSSPRRATSYCVLDDDFARSQFGVAPKKSLKVTAAHEFFHAVQFGYDYREDPWMMESTATWMEERFADGVNDNRRYLRSGQVSAPHVPLDVYNRDGSQQYGNWVFWEYLSTRYGTGIVKQVWEKATGSRYSVQALKKVLARKGGLAKVFRAYASANTITARAYPEGKRWPSAPMAGKWTLGKKSKFRKGSVRVHHLASQSVSIKPGRTLKGRRWQVRVKVDGPSRASAPGAYLVVKKKHGKWVRKPINLSRKGKGKVSFSFNRKQVKSAIITVANASTRYRCGGPAAAVTFACNGASKDDNKLFTVKATVFKKKRR